MPPARAGYPWRLLRILAVGGSQGRDRGHSLSACAAGWCAARLGPHARWAHGTGRLPACGCAGRVRQQTPGSASESAAAAAVVSDSRHHPGRHGPHGPVTRADRPVSSLPVWPVWSQSNRPPNSFRMIQVALQLYRRPGSNYKDKKIRRKSEERSYKVKKDIIKSKCREQSRGRTKFRTCPDTFPMSADISEPKATIQSRPPD